MKALVLETDARQFIWHFKSKGKITANNETFPSRNHAVRAVKGVLKGVAKELGVKEVYFREKLVPVSKDYTHDPVIETIEIQFSVDPFPEPKPKKTAAKKP